MNQNPTEDGDVRDFDAEKEEFLRSYIARQRELHRKSLSMMANLSQANLEMILANGLNEAAAKKSKKAVRETENEVTEKILKQRVQREEMAESAITNFRAALSNGLTNGNIE